MKLRGVCLGIAAVSLVMATLIGAAGNVKAAKHKHPYVARYQASHPARRISFVVHYHTPPRAPRTVCRPVGGYSRLTAPMWRSRPQHQKWTSPVAAALPD